ncbi:uncharacterized protein LOC129874216 [Solanum dulcamara]|uniref:uncharacterized protein LOC129874216 n=1 Tax=Solanum dulcamara TaxID=45834 RepID=UPI0024868CB8|nr:uncharacterized protein LOC129874216 [Solanum dulcamara]
MGSRPKNSSSLRMRRERRSKSGNEKRPKNGVDSFSSDDGDNYSSISEKLEALKQLLPVNNGELKADQLFEETADYIVLLRTQIFVLQKLLDFYDDAASAQSQLNAV